MRFVLLVMLVGCLTVEIDNTPDPLPDAGAGVDAGPDAGAYVVPGCVMSIEPLAPMGSLCLTRVIAHVACTAGVYDRILLGWARFVPVQGAVAELSYRCNSDVSATFSTVCDPPITAGGRMQDPLTGGDLYNDGGILCTGAEWK